MKYVDEYRSGETAKGIAARIREEADPKREYRFMEFCGGHTHVLSRWGLGDILPESIRMIHGPGCPVCVMPIGRIDMAMNLALNEHVILCTYADEQTAALGLLENLQRSQLDPFDTARGIKEVIRRWGCTQAEAARRLGLSQPALANKLRLLQLTGDQRQFVLDNNLTERHARAVLRLPENRRSEALINIAKRRLNARQTDLYIEQLLNSTAKGRHRISMVRDVRIFVNTIDHAIRLMTDNGVPATAHREEKDGYIEYTVRIPTAVAEK